MNYFVPLHADLRNMMEVVHKVLPNNEIIRDLIKLVNEGQRVTLPVKGNSMLPFIIGGKESVELVKPDRVDVDDVVLAWINNSRYVVHRVIKIDGDQIQLMGDGNLTDDEYCQLSDVKAYAEYVIGENGKKRYLYTTSRIRFSRLWQKLLPVRRWILAIYRRSLLKLNIHL
jgi:hypothetical protein